jgi:riboflavin kinase
VIRTSEARIAQSARLTGVVFSDLGRAASFIALDWVAAALEDALGFAAYPGTLNIKLDTPAARETWRNVQQKAAAIEISAPDNSFCAARCFLVDIEGNWRGAVILPDVEGYPADKVEVVAPLRLKDTLKLVDGMRVTLEFVD